MKALQAPPRERGDEKERKPTALWGARVIMPIFSHSREDPKV